MRPYVRNALTIFSHLNKIGGRNEGAAQPNPAAPDLTAQNAQVYVYNNSGVPELASQTAGKLDGQYSVANNSRDAAAMNMPEQTFGVFQETFVFYNPQVTGAEQVAADIA